MIKLGGSLAGSARLKAWVALLAHTGGAAVIVPGGGPFADQVREAQRRLRFDDGTAHHMALLAMEQYGRMLAGLDHRLRPAATRIEIARVCAAGFVPVWMPARMALGRSEIPESWDITSDSLAAWLAGLLRSPRLLIVKSVAVPGASVPATVLAGQGIVDPAFPAFLARSGSEAWCIDAARHRAAAAALGAGAGVGTRIVSANLRVSGAAIARLRRHANIGADDSRARQR